MLKGGVFPPKCKTPQIWVYLTRKVSHVSSISVIERILAIDFLKNSPENKWRKDSSGSLNYLKNYLSPVELWS